jgi:hypothetical protein
MPLSDGYVDGQLVTVLRDSGCRSVIVRRSLVKEEKLTGKFETCILADSTKRTVPTAKVYIDTPYVTGEFEVWCMENPVFDLIVGEVSKAGKPHESNPEWKPKTLLAVEALQNVKDQRKECKLLKVPGIVKDDDEKCEQLLKDEESKGQEVSFLMSIVNSEQIENPESDEDQEEYVGFSSNAESYTDVDINQDLDEVKIQTMKELFQSFSDVFTEQPGHTHLIQHDIRTTTDKPVRVSARHIPFTMVDTGNEEVNNILDMDVIEMSDSSYFSPIVLVTKKDITSRFCVDFRKLNGITVFDAKPMPDVDAMFATQRC